MEEYQVLVFLLSKSTISTKQFNCCMLHMKGSDFSICVIKKLYLSAPIKIDKITPPLLGKEIYEYVS